MSTPSQILSRPSFDRARAAAIAKKEIFHISRDPFTLVLAIVFPIFMILVYGYSIDFNMKNIDLAVSNFDGTRASRELLESFGSSQYFLLHSSGSPVDAVSDVQGERAKAALIIPPRFEKDLFAGRAAKLQVLADGADSTAVSSISSYVGSIQSLSNAKIANFSPTPLYDIRTRFLFNPELNSSWFVIPGLIVVVMAILSIMLTALTVAREWENGSMELLLSTPVQPLEIIVGKLAPYGCLGLLTVALTFLIARTVFGVPFVGNIFVFALGAILFLVTYLAQGLLISVVTRNQAVAMQLAMVSGLLPSQLLSGFIFPISSMPLFFRGLTMIMPARWFMEISRDTFLKGSSLSQLTIPFTILTFICVFIIRMASRKFKRDLEP